MKDVRFQDESGDRKYFTIIPNYILNHSTLWDREVYIQMKRITGENGTCWTSKATLARQCGMSKRRLDKSIKYLLEHDWIKKIGDKVVNTTGGPQEVGEYKIIDLWDKNNNFYQEKFKGGAPKTLPIKQRGCTDDVKGGAPYAYKEEQATKKNPISKQSFEKVFSLEEEIKILEDSPRRDLNIVALYLDRRRPDIRNREQLSVAIKRHLKPAGELKGFSDDQILDAVPRAKRLTPEWTLETLVKVLIK